MVFAAFNGFPLGMESFHPPFNKLSNHRDPGRVNINTILSGRVWGAVVNDLRVNSPVNSLVNPSDLLIVPKWPELVASRRGFLALQPQLPPFPPTDIGLLLPPLLPPIVGQPALPRPPSTR